MPLNCVNGDHVQDENDFGVGRQRPATYGFEQKYYEESIRTQCNINTEEIVGDDPTAADVHADRVCRPGTSTTTTTTATTSTNTNIASLLQKLEDRNCNIEDLQAPTDSPLLMGAVTISDITKMFLEATLLGTPDTEECKELKAVLILRKLAQAPTTTTTIQVIGGASESKTTLSTGLIVVAVLAGVVLFAIMAIIAWIRMRDPHKPKARNPVTVVQSPNKKGLSTPYYSSTHYHP